MKGGTVMFKYLHNKKGFLFGGLGTVASVFWCIALVNVGIAAARTPGHRIKKAVAKCEAEGKTNCEEKVSSWSKEEVLEYIRDNEEVEQVKMRPRLGGQLQQNEITGKKNANLNQYY